MFSNQQSSTGNSTYCFALINFHHLKIDLKGYLYVLKVGFWGNHNESSPVKFSEKVYCPLQMKLKAFKSVSKEKDMQCKQIFISLSHHKNKAAEQIQIIM